MSINIDQELITILILLILGFLLVGTMIGFVIGYRTHHWDMQREQQYGYPKDCVIDEKDSRYSAETAPSLCGHRYNCLDDLGCTHTRDRLRTVAESQYKYNSTEIPLYRDGLSPLAVRRG